MIKKIIFYGILVFSGLNAFCQKSSENIRLLREKAIREIEYSNKLLEETKGKTKESLNEINIINHKLNKRKEYLKRLEVEIGVISSNVDKNISAIADIEEEISKLKKVYALLIYSLYRINKKGFYIMYFLASDNMNQLYRRVRYIRLYNNYLKSHSEKLIELQINLKTKNLQLNELIDDKKVLVAEEKNEYGAIQKEIVQKNKVLQRLKNREKEIKADIREKERIAAKLENELKRIIAEERKKAGNANIRENLTPAERIISNDFERNIGRLPWPTQKGVITGKYGEHEHPDYKSVKIKNDGIYISTTTGELARSIFKGVVSRVFSIPGENYTVIIKHGRYYTLYHNLVNVQVKAGQVVDTKQVIGTVFSNEKTKDTTLYFQVWKETERNDPELWLVH
jgi:septal ring factor EnvC (AmiA/AmiB activator)